MIPDALAFRDSYKSLKMPVAIIAGEEDRVIDNDAQSARPHRYIAHSTLQRVPGVGYMVHQSPPSAVLQTVDASVPRKFGRGPLHNAAPWRNDGPVLIRGLT